jgi:hypothetical protein
MCRNDRKMRQGFLKAIGKQQAMFSKDPMMLDLLNQKKQEVKKVYRQHTFSQTVVRKAGRLLRSTIKAVLPKPWLAELKKLKKDHRL